MPHSQTKEIELLAPQITDLTHDIRSLLDGPLMTINMASKLDLDSETKEDLYLTESREAINNISAKLQEIDKLIDPS